MKHFSWIFPFIVGLLLIVGLAENLPSGSSRTPLHDSIFDNTPLLKEAFSIIKDRYPGKIEERKLLDGAVDGMLKSLDSFCEYLGPREFTEIQNEAKGEYGGVGLVVTVKGDFPEVMKVLVHSPAEQAGIFVGDSIIRVEDRSCFRISILELIEELRGRVGSEVKLIIRRPGVKEDFEVTLRRVLILVESVRESRFIPPNVGYIKLVEFVEKTRDDLDDAITQLKKDGARHLILDLRHNMGGTLEAAIRVADKFLSRGKLIVKTDGKLPQDRASFYSSGKHSETDIPLTILVNRTSASASEIVAGALKDHKRARILGEKTFGKGSVQSLFTLSDGSGIRLTTAHYVTPSGQIIDHQGIEPDVAVSPAPAREAAKELEEKEDLVLEKALELSRKEILTS